MQANEKHEAERQMKQKYLREQIIGENWDGEEFSKYLEERREDGTNIDIWEFEDLIAEVENFKHIKKIEAQAGDSNVKRNTSKRVKNSISR